MIEIRALCQADIRQAQRLWEEAFPEDAEAFATWYFEHRFLPEDCYGLFEKGRLLSMAQVGKEPLWLNGTVLQANFLRGVATAKGQEGKGYASQLIHFILRDLESQGEAISILKTFIHPFYRRTGYEVYSQREVKKIEGVEGEKSACHIYSSVKEISEALLLQLLDCYHAYLKGKSGYLYRDAAYLRRYLEEALDFSEGLLIVPKESEAYCIAYPENGALYAEEIVGEGENLPMLFAKIAKDMGMEFSYLCPHAREGEPDAMARAVSAQALLEKTARQGSARIGLKDEILAGNCGVWEISAFDGTVSVRKAQGQEADICLNSGQLALLCMGGRLPDRELPECVQELWSDAQLGIFEQY